jgi:thioredoxin-related protein
MKTPIVLLSIAMLAGPVLADPPAFQKDLLKTVHAATKDKKMAFILLGREACGNCQATKAMINDGKIPVTAETFVAGDLNIDDRRVQSAFMQKYQKEKFGNTLPFVVITDSRGKALASSGGYKSPEQWTALIDEAKKKFTAQSGTSR